MRKRKKPSQLECKGEEHSCLKEEEWVPKLSGGEKSTLAKRTQIDADAEEEERREIVDMDVCNMAEKQSHDI